MNARDASAAGTRLARANELAVGAGRTAELEPLGVGRWLLPTAEQYAAAQAAPHTAGTHRSTLRSFALYVQTELGMAATTDALALSTVLDDKRHLQATDPATGRPRAQTATIAKQLSALRGFARWLALDDELAGVDARIQLIKSSRGDPPLPRALTAQQLRRVLAMPDRATTRGKRDLALLELLAHACLRRAEAAALRWEHLIQVQRWPDAQMRRAVASVPAEQISWAVRIEHSKRGRSRTVPLAASVLRALQEWRRTSAAGAARHSAAATVFIALAHPRVPHAGGDLLLTYRRCDTARSCKILWNDLDGRRATFRNLTLPRCTLSTAPSQWRTNVAYGLSCTRNGTADYARSGLYVKAKGKAPRRLSLPKDAVKFGARSIEDVDLRASRVAAIAADIYEYAFSQSLTGRHMWSMLAAASEGDSSSDARGVALGTGGSQWTLTNAEHLDDPKRTIIYRLVGTCLRTEIIQTPATGDYAATGLAIDGNTLYLIVPGTGITTHKFTPQPTPSC